MAEPHGPQAETEAETDAVLARRLVAGAMSGTLATVEPGGAPFASLAAVACDAEGSVILLLSDLARHTRNLRENPRAALMAAEAGAADPLAGNRVTLSGRIARPGDAGRADALRARFLARHPEARAYADFADFGVYLLVPEEAHLIAGFGRIRTIPATAYRRAMAPPAAR